jgi:epoxyqueuosine reductase
VCPFNVKFSEPAAELGYAARGPGERPVGVEVPAGPGASAETEGSRHPGTDSPLLTDLFRMALSEEAWESFSRGSAIRRAGRAGFARNVAVALGNWLAGQDEPPSGAVSVLIEALADPEPLVRGHAAWALGGVGSPEALQALGRLLESEHDPRVRTEASSTLARSR